ncbi:MAG: helix-turn-helix protein [Paenibacillus sp.]|jgi:AraC-like DNA-binding protein|nr:helix-turn-helix protein [Paenibacillus sp.]
MEQLDEVEEHGVRICKAVHGLTGIDSVYMNLQGELIHECFSVPRPLFPASFQEDGLSQMISRVFQLSNEQVCLHTGGSRLSYVAAPIPGNGGIQGAVAVGPFLNDVPDDAFIREVMEENGCSRSENRQYALSYRSLSVLGERKIQELGTVLLHLCHMPVKPAAVVKSGVRKEHELRAKLNKGYPSVQPDLIVKRYELERQLLHAVQQGHEEQVKLLRENAKGQFDFSYRLPHDPLRSMKNAAITMNTLIRKAAEYGGVHVVDIHIISESYAIRIEKAHTFAGLTKLIDLMTYEYCAAVKAHSLKGCTPLIRQALQWLQLHYTEAFRLPVLAHELHTDPAHLSRQFKKETGQTLTEYIRHKRIEEAKYLLETGSHSISETAWRVGYADLNHFGKVFKQTVGCTPSEYIRNMKR